MMLGAMDMNMNMGANLLRPRVSTVSNLQTFSGALGGAVADPVCSCFFLHDSYLEVEVHQGCVRT